MDLYLDFLYRNNNADLLILNRIKDALPPRNSVLHNATVICNALMHSGTSVDRFWKNNQEWLRKASNWAKFSATASLGVIYKVGVRFSIDPVVQFMIAHCLDPPVGGTLVWRKFCIPHVNEFDIVALHLRLCLYFYLSCDSGSLPLCLSLRLPLSVMIVIHSFLRSLFLSV